MQKVLWTLLTSCVWAHYASFDPCLGLIQNLFIPQIANNHVAEVHIFKQFHKNIIGKGGANIRGIRDETDTKIDLPSENSDSDVITITGKKPNVDQAVARIEAIQRELVSYIRSPMYQIQVAINQRCTWAQ